MIKKQVLLPEQLEEIRTKDFFDCIAPATIKFYSDYYIIGDSIPAVNGRPCYLIVIVR